MKRDKKTWFYFCAQVLFMLIAPCVFIWLQYGDLSQKYKLSATAILLTILIFWIFKKIFLSKWLKTFDQKIINIETNALTITDPIAIQSNKKAWRFYSLIQLLINSIIPILLMVGILLTIKVVEEGIIKLYGCLFFCLISVVVGVLFKIAEIYSIKLNHEA